jgi:hypothetical protein
MREHEKYLQKTSQSMRKTSGKQDDPWEGTQKKHANVWVEPPKNMRKHEKDLKRKHVNTQEKNLENTWESMDKHKNIWKHENASETLKTHDKAWKNLTICESMRKPLKKHEKSLRKYEKTLQKTSIKNLRKNEDKPGRGSKGGTACDFSRWSPRRRAFSCFWAMRGRWSDRIWAIHNPMVAISTLCSQCQASHCQYNPGSVELACMCYSCTKVAPRFEPIFPSIDHIHDPLHIDTWFSGR